MKQFDNATIYSMKITTLTNAKKVPFDLDGRIMFSDEKNEIINLTLKKGEVLDLHTNPFDVIFYILQGKGIYFTEEQTIEIEQNSCFEVESSIKRGWKNESETDFKLLVIKRL